jgi:hypothetical protein
MIFPFCTYNSPKIKLSSWWGPWCLSFRFFYVVPLCAWVPCCDVRYDFRITTMFGSSLPPVVYMRAHVFVCFCVCMFAHSDFQHDVAHLFGFLCFVFCFVCLRVPSVVSFSGLSVIGCPLGFLWGLLTNCNELSPLTHRALYVIYTRFYYTSPGIVLFTKWN